MVRGGGGCRGWGQEPWGGGEGGVEWMGRGVAAGCMRGAVCALQSCLRDAVALLSAGVRVWGGCVVRPRARRVRSGFLGVESGQREMESVRASKDAFGERGLFAMRSDLLGGTGGRILGRAG